MACGSGNLIARISAANRNIDRRLIREIALEHFKKIKVEISDAIETTFPFLEILRDRGFISEKIYEDSQDSCRNLIPVQKVVYNVLSEVEKTFDLSLLETLFNEVMMKSYPALKRIFESFIAVIQQGNRQERNETERRESLTAQQSLEQGTGENYLPWINTDASHSNEPSVRDTQEATCSRPQIAPVRRRGSSAESSVKNEHPRALSSELRSGPGEKDGKRQKGSSPHLHVPNLLQCTVNLGKNSTLGKSKGKRNTMVLGSNSILGKRTRKRRLKVNTNERVNFHSEILPVTCGTVKGMLNKNKLKQGATVKSIQSEDGNWYTPREFEVKGGYEKSSNWKLSVRSGGKTLKCLMEEGLVPNPPRTYSRKKKILPPGLLCTPQLLKPLHDIHSKVKEEHRSVHASPQSARRNSDECNVCHDGGTLFCCDTCSRSFHEDCHLPPVETKRSPWSCIFCRIKLYSGSQKCHKEYDVLTRQMGPEEQLKCEFLLMNIYCHPVMNIFKKTANDNYRKETSQCMEELMRLNDIKQRLYKRSYSKVGMCVGDIRLIFHIHKAPYKCSNFVLMKHKLQKEFEKNFKDVFAIRETNE
ncbi:nuclear body protein SP140-like protein isoform X3 [Rousettus aegyptiacus]|uniref:nuclear body protein SP140-like protein isoform X3 n=1 Tax=Rousettus aegyptiacus TaxID=9407 RepID=UPI00168D6603|nr:nuclear body protein SP140-like protein isoform X3 [Rousettus aegyptiacus]